MKQVTNVHPPKGGRYRVFRLDVGEFHATVCYGMHNPWWIPRNNFTNDESDPVDMRDTDLWEPALRGDKEQ